MFTKIYLALFVVALLVILTVTFLTYSQLQSVGFPPLTIIDNFQFYDSWHKTILWISSIALLVLANVILWTSRRSWALWLTFVYFGVFILLNMWWLSDAFIAYSKRNNLWNGSFNAGGLFAAFFVVVVGIGIFFNQFIVIRLHDKMFNQQKDVPETVESVENEAPASEE
ncbi:MAG: hypothetical protein AAB336_07655 [Acidobacteriota bacterium]